MKQHISIDQVKKVAELAQLSVSEAQAEKLAVAFDETLGVIDNLRSIDISAVEPTHQVTGLENVLREDQVKPEKSFSQADALANAAHSHAGYFVVQRIIDND